jgi:signal peptidase I
MTALLLALTLKSYVAEAYEIKGSSMLPTFHDGERVVVLKSFFDVERSDIVIFTSTEDTSKDLIKRVVALPGDEIEIINDQVWVNGILLDEAYVYSHEPGHSGYSGHLRQRVGPDECFVLGDNRGDSHDSRRFSGVPLRNLKGKVVVRWWPLDCFSSF